MNHRHKMKFLVLNKSPRTHCIDRDIKPGQIVEYSTEEFGKLAKCFAACMRATNHKLTQGHTKGSDSVYEPGAYELEICAEINGQRALMTREDVLNFAAEYSAAPAPSTVEVDEKELAEFRAWKAAQARA